MRTIRRLLAFAEKFYLTLAIICMILVAGFNLLLPQFFRIILDGLMQKKYDAFGMYLASLFKAFAMHFGEQHTDVYSLMPYYCAAILGLFILRGATWFSSLALTELVAQKAVYKIRNLLFDHMQHLSFSYHDEAETGQLISRSISDIEIIRQFFSEGILHFVHDGSMVIGIIAVCFCISWKLAITSLAILPFLGIAVYRFRSIVGPLFAAVQEQMGVMTTAIQQNLMGIRVAKAFAREDYETYKFDKQARELYNRVIAASRVQAKYQPLMDFMTSTGLVVVLWYGSWMVLHQPAAGAVKQDVMTPGMVVAFYYYIAMLGWPVRILGWVVMMGQWAVASATRVFEVLDTHPEVHLKDGCLPMDCCNGAVEFKDLGFCYPDGSRVLSNVTLQVEPGEMVAFVGATGSGKSTIINLLPRFYDVTDGALLIDGVDIRKYRLTSLRRNISIVSQETFLFGDTIRENIAYGNPDAPLEEVIEAAKQANIHDFIISLPDQYETRVGERGVNLSGGQKQRIAIARALMMNPPILIMDDSTSSVDTETEGLIQKALISLTESRTTFVVAQRISTIKRANKIVVLDNGRMAECGTHEDLMARDGVYTEIYRTQFRIQETTEEAV